MTALKECAVKFICLSLASIPSWTVYAHGVGPWGVQPLEWRNDQVSQVIAFAFSGTGRRISIEGKDCLVGSSLHFKVRDDYAFDIDETVWLDLEFYMESIGSKLSVIYDRNGVAPMGLDTAKALQLPGSADSHWYRQSIPLERARFANGGFDGSDFAIQGSYNDRMAAGEFTICNLSLRRSYTTPVAKVFGWAAIDVVDEHGQTTPVRMGLYDPSGRLPLPSDEAVTVRNLTGATRVVALHMGASPWPVKNRSVFYTGGRYHTRLPVGQYELIVAKGPEYRLARQRFWVQANETKSIKVKLRRWTDMAAKGWYSGEDHIHYARASAYDDHILQLVVQAEDLRVANILQMGNSANTYFPQYDWRSNSTDREASFVLVPGQEDPRTSRRGHTIQLNIKEPVRNPAHYLLYHEVFEKVRAQGGLVGYAHVTEGHERRSNFSINVTRGMAVDVPFGLVDFAEIFSGSYVGDSTWFDFLNLGYKLSPSAGTDYPFGDLPGTVRNYVKIERRFTPHAWFDELKKGSTFVTSGPMLEISINGQDMGSEIHVRSGEPLMIRARASINPDIDALSSLELIEQGESVKAVSSQGGASEMELRHDLPAKRGTWFVLRARGKNPEVIAVSGPIYIFVDGQSFWKPSAVSSIVVNLKLKMQEILEPGQLENHEVWETWESDARYLDAQQGLLKERVDQASAIYDDLVKRAATLSDEP